MIREASWLHPALKPKELNAERDPRTRRLPDERHKKKEQPDLNFAVKQNR